MKTIKRSLLLILTLCIVINSTVIYASGYSINNNISSSYEYVIEDLGKGSYQIVDTNRKIQKSNIGGSFIDIVKVEDDIYKAKDSSLAGKNEMFLKVKDNIFQKVERIELGYININNIEDKITKYKIQDEIAADLRKTAESVERDNLETEAILYTPDSATYYFGYMDYRYRDEVLYYYNRTPYKEVKKGVDLEDVSNILIRTIAEYTIDATSYSYLGVGFILYDLFSSIFTVFPVNTGDWWQVQLYETKYKRYTAIDTYWDEVYLIKAISEKGSGYFNHLVYDYSEDIEAGPKKTTTLNYVLDNYNGDLDYYAFRSRYPSDLPYIEEMSRWKVNTFYSFSSI